MRFLDLIAQVQSRIGVTSTDLLEAIKREINNGLREIEGRLPDAHWLRQERMLTTVGLFTDGTATFTLGSKVVTKASGTGFFSTRMVGGLICKDGDNTSYRIDRWISSTVVHLQFPYRGTTATTTYRLGTMEYLLPLDVLRILDLMQFESPTRMLPLSRRDARWAMPDPLNQGEIGIPVAYWITEPQRTALYSTGHVVSATNGSRLITLGGSPNLVADGVDLEGLTFRLQDDPDGDVYVVGDILTNTTLDLDEPYRGDTFAGATKAYQIGAPGCRRVALYPVPDQEYQFLIRYTRRHPRLSQDNDNPALPEEQQRALLYFSQARMLEHIGDMQEAMVARQEFERTFAELKSNAQIEDRDFVPVLQHRPPYSAIDANYPGFRLPGNYEPWGF